MNADGASLKEVAINNGKEAAVEVQQETPKSKKNKALACMRTNLLTILTIGGVVGGGVLGFVLRAARDSSWSEREIMYIEFLGDLFLRMLKCLILPLIVSSLVSAVASLDLSLSGRIAARTVAFYLTTTFFSVVLGIIMVVSIRPGKNKDETDIDSETTTVRNVTTVDTLLDLVRNMFPPNIVQACTQQYSTVLVSPDEDNATNIYDWEISSEYTDSTNIIGLVVFSAVLGITLAKLQDEGKPLRDLFDCLLAAIMKITHWVIWLSPVGVMFLVAAKILEMDSFSTVMSQLGLYFATVLAGLLLQGFVILPTLYLLLTKKSPIKFLANMGQPIATAFGTASSSASLPITIKCLEDDIGIDPRVARFCLPIGATINMDGTALYEAVAAIFIAQVRNVDLSIGNLIAISVTATAAAIGAAGIPQAGLVTMVMVLDTVGLPAEDVSLIIAVDWLLDRFRTTINVLGDAFGAAIVHHRSKKELEKNTLPVPPVPEHR